MKTTIIPINRQTIEEFADNHNLEMEVRELHPENRVSQFYAHFKNAEVLRGRCLASVSGRGRTPELAIEAYAPQISGQRLVIDAYRDTRREIVVPCLV